MGFDWCVVCVCMRRRRREQQVALYVGTTVRRYDYHDIAPHISKQCSFQDKELDERTNVNRSSNPNRTDAVVTQLS